MKVSRSEACWVTAAREFEAEVKSGRSADSSQFLNRAVYHYVVARDLGEEYTQLRAYSAERRRPAA